MGTFVESSHRVLRGANLEDLPMDTESIAREIVTIKNRLQELDDQLEVAGDTEMSEERAQLLERMRNLQDELAEHGGGDKDTPAQPHGVQDVRPA
jgi:chromosome segregation ATPase